MLKIKDLNKEFLIENIKDFIAIDKVIGEGSWNESNFLADLDSKWQLSTCGIYNDQIAGYIIASNKDGFIHIHRNVIGNEWQGKGLGSQNLRDFLVRKAKNSAVRLKVHVNNSRAIKFYLKNHLKILGQERDYFWMEINP